MRGLTVHTASLTIVLGPLPGLLLGGPGCLFDAGDSTARVWMSIAPIQCGGNAWETERKSIEDYLSDRGAHVLDAEAGRSTSYSGKAILP